LSSPDRYPSPSPRARVLVCVAFAALAVGVFALVLRLPSRGGVERAGGVEDPIPVSAAAGSAEAERAGLRPEKPQDEWAAGCPDLLEDAYGPASLCEEIRGTFRRRQTVSDLFLRHGFTPDLVHAVSRSARPVFDLRRVRAGQPYTLAKVGTTFCHFRYEIDPESYLQISACGSALTAEILEYPFEVRVDSLAGAITSSLFQSVLEAGEGPDLALALSEIFAWDIDFFLDIRKGDRYKVFFERRCLGDSMVCYGQVLAAEFVVQGISHLAVYFCDGTGYDDYYDGEGGSLRRALLKAPLRYSRISSTFSHRRFHPIRRHYAPHLGIDYAAPTGTPVQATGDGVVVFAARSGANGNMVKIRHNETFTTYYLHLSKFARGIKKGSRVKQGDVIGYVGSTGLSTGPHLDYRIKKHDKFVDPRRVDLPASQPVTEAYRAEFETLRDQWLARLGRLGSKTDELALGGPAGPRGAASAER